VKLSDLASRLGLTMHQSQGRSGIEVSGAYTSDLLSDVMAYGREKNVWITCQTHENIVAVAKLKNLAAVILVNSRRPDEATLRRAQEENILLYSTSDTAFVITGKLYNLLNSGTF
jgi:hypothetical protein